MIKIRKWDIINSKDQKERIIEKKLKVGKLKRKKRG